MEVKDITSRDVDFAKWYTDVCRKADLVDYSSIKGSMIIRPLGYAIWEEMVKVLDNEFKKTNHENVQMPLFIPESLLNVEKEHVEGFAPEVAWVTHGGSNLLDERMCVRPTSEVLFCDHYKKIIKSYRDLPKLYNQWCTIVRWEKTTRPFLRSREILWQEGHTMHETKEEALEETLRMFNIYKSFQEKYLAMPVITGRKTEKEKFAGAEITYTIEAMMYDGFALQNGTSHYFGQNFTKAFDITFIDKFNKLLMPYQTSWGVSTRMIGGLIMTHSDNNGLVLPPKIAPTKVIIIPIGEVREKLNLLKAELLKEGITFKVDESEKSPGFKFAEAEVKGYPIRVELGKRDLENNNVTLVRRDTLEKIVISYEEIVSKVKELLVTIQDDLYEKALTRRNSMIYDVLDYEELKTIAATKPGFIKINWCGNVECENKIKEDTTLKSRCLIEDEEVTAPCVVCGKPATTRLYIGKQY
ncbi:MAG: proline--tRNA ligase [Bacilli bacterium]